MRSSVRVTWERTCRVAWCLQTRSGRSVVIQPLHPGSCSLFLLCSARKCGGHCFQGTPESCCFARIPGRFQNSELCLLTVNDRHQGRASHLRPGEAARPLGGQASKGGVHATQWVHTRCHVLSQPRNFPGESGSGGKCLRTSW